MFSLITSYDDAWKAIIMPPRQEYTVYDLGPNRFNAKQNKILRVDLQLRNKRGHILECSFYQQANITSPHPCVVYLHGSGCSRIEAIQYLDLVLAHPISFFTFDFTGSGKSEGVYSSVGWFEQEDLECVIDYIRGTGKISKIALWGRSMGATTSIFYGAKHGGIECMILDSPFANFKKFIKEFIKKKLPLPGFLASGAFDMIRKTILKKANFDLGELKPIRYINKVKIPLLFGVGEGDTFVPIDHTIDLHAASRGEKKLLHVFEGDHNSTRPPIWMKYVSDFLIANLLPVPAKKESQPHFELPIPQASPSNASNFYKSRPHLSQTNIYDSKNRPESPYSMPFTQFTLGPETEMSARDHKVYQTIASVEDIAKKPSIIKKGGKSNEVGSFKGNESNPSSPQRYRGPTIVKNFNDPDSKNSFVTSYTNSSFKQNEESDLFGISKRSEQKTGPKLVISDPREMVSKGDKTHKPDIQGQFTKLKGKDGEPPVAPTRGHHRAASSINGSLPNSNNSSNSHVPHYMQKIEHHPTSTFSLASLNLHTSESPSINSSNSVYSMTHQNQPMSAQDKRSSLSTWTSVPPNKNLYAREKSEIPLSDPNNKSPSKRQNQSSISGYNFNRDLSIKIEVSNPSTPYAHQNLQVRTPNDYSKPINLSYGTNYQNFESFSHLSSMNSTSATNSYSAANIKGKFEMKGSHESGQASSYDDKFRMHPIAREFITSERKMSADLNAQKSRFHTNRS